MIGYRATGKSHVGRLVAEARRVPFIDTDRMVEAAIGTLISRYFADRGESAFRDREEEALRAFLHSEEARSGAVVATGGGIILNPRNVGAIRSAGVAVWLTASVETIRDRLKADPASDGSRPALTMRSVVEEVASVLAAREPLYRDAADVEISTDGRAPEDVAAAVVEWLDRVGSRVSAGR